MPTLLIVDRCGREVLLDVEPADDGPEGRVPLGLVRVHAVWREDLDVELPEAEALDVGRVADVLAVDPDLRLDRLAVERRVDGGGAPEVGDEGERHADEQGRLDHPPQHLEHATTSRLRDGHDLRRLRLRIRREERGEILVPSVLRDDASGTDLSRICHEKPPESEK